MANVRAAQAIAQNINSSWPKPIKYFAGGVNGRVFHTNDGRLMKFVYDYAPEEFEALQKLQKTAVVPRFKKGNATIMHLDKKTSKDVKRLMFPHAKRLSDDLTVFIMSRVGGPNGMTLRNYVNKYPITKARREYIQKRVDHIISEMHMRGVSQGNLHHGNIIVSVNPKGEITGMWAIDFGRAFYHSPGKTERQAFGTKMFNQMYATKSAFSPTSMNVPVRQGSRPNTRMAWAVYNKAIPAAWGERIARLRKQVLNEMKQYRSPTARGSSRTPRSLTSKPKAKSASPSRSATRPSSRPRSAPARVSVTRKSPVRATTLKRKRASSGSR
jgi:hypothetical protein